jgi:glycerophosphoryl diester phosphodiesterase
MSKETDFNRSEFDLQGHRGCRGLMPENTIPAFRKALELGVNTLELDVVISKDRKVVVSHEPWLNPETCTLPDTGLSKKAIRKKYNLFEMDYSDIAQFDCGSKMYSKFPDQLKFEASKPLLEEVIQFVESQINGTRITPIQYNIEIKFKTEGSGLFHPEREEYLDLFYSVIRSNAVIEKVTLQCFDIGILQMASKKYPDLRLILLIDNWKSAKRNIHKLGFKPFAYSPNYIKMSRSDVNFLKKENIKIIPWTVNKKRHIKKLILMGVDGLISDYPDSVNKVLQKF